MNIILFSFAVDRQYNVLIPKDPNITQAGGSEMSQFDILKLQNAYGCTACGGYQSSSTGGLLTSSESRKNSYCDWLLNTESNKQIILNFQVFCQLFSMSLILK